MFREEDEEGESFNSFCMCTLDNSNRSLSTFNITAPDTGSYFLKLYAVPEVELSETQGGLFNFMASFKITFTKVVHNVKPWPVSSEPFGLTPAYNSLGVSMVVKDPKVWEADRKVLQGCDLNFLKVTS